MRYIVFILFYYSVWSFIGCDKRGDAFDNLNVGIDPPIIIEEIDSIYIHNVGDDIKNTFFLVRHAEKEFIGNDPGLDAFGLLRAENLAVILQEVSLEKIYSTPFNRSIETALPSAELRNLGIDEYSNTDSKALLDLLPQDIPIGNALIIAHSYSIPEFLNQLSNSNSYQDIPSFEYDNLYIIQIDTIGGVDILHYKYGI